ncbi:hypothetical protein L210DRAFT_3400417 [Boletus edulis BED1]|uniref:Uncharacterized protein n=1 Tax=Boletus edulis BED1 TaxID=1328754 RepID=A0AAD4GFN6_BOLED|nr:hypothetical protein L210DRAFT_3400417 [Boletus edulis BED1]
MVTYSRPVNPTLDPNNSRLNEHLQKLVRAVQMHKCSPACRRVKDGRLVCKRRAPFILSDHSWIDAEGNWGPKRSISSMNAWNPWLLNCIRANHDIKFLTNGEATKNLSFYITAYAAKNQQRSSNMSALLAKAFKYKTHSLSHKEVTTVQQLNKHLIQQCANTLTQEQELSAPEVISYLMGWGDRYISHQFVPIHFNSVIRCLKSSWPFLDEQR